MNFDKLEALVQKEFIGGVLKPFSPNITHRREYKGQHYPGYEIGVSTKLCKFLFVWEEGGGVMIGPSTSNFENTQDKEKWFDLERIICFVSRQPFVWEFPYQDMPREAQVASAIHDIQKAFTPYVYQIVSMFSSEEKMSEWVLDYENYVDEQFKLKYPSYYESYMKQKQASKLKRNQQ